MDVGFISPLPPVRSGIADYSVELLPPLSESVRVTTYSPAEAERALRAGHQVLLVQIGNDPLHLPSVEALRNRRRVTPAVVVLHDFSIHHLFAAGYLDRGREKEYDAELVRSHGERGRVLAAKSRNGPRVPVWDLDPWAYPMSTGLIRDASALIVHSRLVKGAVLRAVPERWVVEVPHHVVPAPRTGRAEARRLLRLPENRIVAVTLGVVTPAKRIGQILEALASIPKETRPFLFVGGAVGEDDPLHGTVSGLDLAGDISFGGYLSEEEFWLAASAADFALNLRHPTVGETSGAVCRLAGFGVPLLVSDVGWFRELPEDFASKIPVGRGEVEALRLQILRLAGDTEERNRRGHAAREWGRERSPERVAALYLNVLNSVCDGTAALRGARGSIASDLDAFGVGRPGRFGSSSRMPDALLISAVAEAEAGLRPRALRNHRE